MFRKKIFGSLFALTLALTTFSSSAFATTLVVDNDATSSAPGYNFKSGTWSYKTDSGYNGDYRIISSSQLTYANYGWSFNTSNKTASNYVYLSNANFTNPKAAYQIGNNGSYVYLNQNTAPGGWNFLKTETDLTGAPIFINLNGAISSTTGNAGADASKIVY